METSDWVIVAAVVIGPVLAVQVQKWVESARVKRIERKMIFQTLMRTRAARLAPDHIQALNSIELGFYGKKFLGKRWQGRKLKAVTEAWDEYFDHLNTKPSPEDRSAGWWTRGDDLLNALLYKMSEALGYDFNRVTLRRSIYSPVAEAERDQEFRDLRQGLVKIFKWQAALPVVALPPPPAQDPTAQAQNPARPVISPDASPDSDTHEEHQPTESARPDP